MSHSSIDGIGSYESFGSYAEVTVRSLIFDPQINDNLTVIKSLELCSSSGKPSIVFLTYIWVLGVIVGLAEYSFAHLLRNPLIWSPQIQGTYLTCSKFSTKKCCHMFTMVQINLTFLGQSTSLNLNICRVKSTL